MKKSKLGIIGSLAAGTTVLGAIVNRYVKGQTDEKEGEENGDKMRDNPFHSELHPEDSISLRRETRDRVWEFHHGGIADVLNAINAFLITSPRIPYQENGEVDTIWYNCPDSLVGIYAPYAKNLKGTEQLKINMTDSKMILRVGANPRQSYIAVLQPSPGIYMISMIRIRPDSGVLGTPAVEVNNYILDSDGFSWIFNTVFSPGLQEVTGNLLENI